MDGNSTSITRAYRGVTVVSPSMFGDEKKDQDRARWFEPGQIACDCDGVSSSPYSQRAAELVTNFAPVLFGDNDHSRLTLICDLLTALRQESQQNCNVALPIDTPVAMQPMLTRVIRQKLAASFQTTMVAAKFISREKSVIARVIRCGDSAFFASSPEGELLSSSLSFIKKPESSQEAIAQQSESSLAGNSITFGPGDEILVQVTGLLSQHSSLASRAGVRPEHQENWLVCHAVDSCHSDSHSYQRNLVELATLRLKRGDLLLVPKFLYGVQLTSESRQYRVLRFSTTMRSLPSSNGSAPTNRFSKHGSATMVLPDHFYRGRYDSYQDSFPIGTEFVLCSDGFYSTFADWHELWAWLTENANRLSREEERKDIVRDLHAQLHNKNGDDDISFVWVRPRARKLPDPEYSEPNKERI